MTTPTRDDGLPEPVAWLQVGVFDGPYEGETLTRAKLPLKYDPSWWRFDGLYSGDQMRAAIARGLAWREAVDDMLTVQHEISSNDPRESINRLINWNVAVALDPAVSSDAAALVERGRAQHQREVEALRAALGTLLSATNPSGDTPVDGWKSAWRQARAALQSTQEKTSTCRARDVLEKTVRKPFDKLSKECHWSQDGEDSDIWAAQCGRYFTINDGSPSDNEMRFCCFCGKPLVEIRFEDEHE